MKNKSKTNGNLSLASIGLIITAILFLFATETAMGKAHDNIRYYSLILFTVAGYIELFCRYRAHRAKFQNYGMTILVIPIFCVFVFILDCIQSYKVGVPFTKRIYVQIALLLMPALYSYVLINLISLPELEFVFTILLWIGIFFYIFVEGTGISRFFVLQNYLLYFDNGDTQLESHNNFFPILFYFLNYCRYSDTARKHKTYYNTCWILSFVFVLFAHKRLSMLFALFLMLLNVCVKLRRTIPRYIPFLTALVFPIVTYFYTAFVKGELFTNKISKASLYKFTTGREYILSLWKNKHYLSYGYGSSYDLIGRYLEMDLVEMYMEIGIIAVLAFALCYFAIVRKSFYAYLLMTYEFLGMLTSSSIPNPLSWTLVLLTIACFASDKQSDEETFTDNHRLSLRHHKSIVKAQ